MTDGDTFDLRTEDRGVVRVRFAAIDAPERGQAFSRQATQHLKALLSSRPVEIHCFKADGHGREVCNVEVAGDDVGLAMIAAGFAWHFVRFEKEQQPDARVRYAQAEADAKQAARGLWSRSDAMPPWDCRSVRREGKSCP